MIEKTFEPLLNKENKFKKLLSVRKVAAPTDRSTTLNFSVTGNFKIFISEKSHFHLAEKYGVDPDKTLTEGYVYFDKNGKIKEISFKPPMYQPTPGFKGSEDELIELKSAVRELLRESLSEKDKKTMKEVVILATLALLLPSTVFAAVDPALKECLQRGYENIFQDNKNYCVLPNKSQCLIEEFNNGTCGAQYKNDDYCVAEGRPVWDTNKCCAGTEAYLKPNFLGQPSCIKISTTQKIINQIKYNPYIRFGGLGIIFISIIFLIISKAKTLTRN